MPFVYRKTDKNRQKNAKTTVFFEKMSKKLIKFNYDIDFLVVLCYNIWVV